MSNQNDVSPEQARIIQEKFQRRVTLRNEFLKLRTDPFRHAGSEGGSVFDPAFLRFQALNVSYAEFFKPTGSAALKGIALLFLPMFGLGYVVWNSRQANERAYRSGEVAYKDRHFRIA
ncbi:hypothetical protein ABEB36_013367 [Hypothenemus hampei]|uniref:NADH dehydrogenase [ubiquinone] 1 beta subcomplex subunit 4 n=1 Tax=Hypothenemus hampei TaxID=57062 RepID=A0ABD1E7S3_HYPHA